MMAGNLYTEQARKQYAPRTGFTGAVLLAVLCVALSLFTFFCPGAEAAVPKPEEISGDYHYYAEDTQPGGGTPMSDSGTERMILRGNTLYWVGKEGSAAAAYNAQTGTARWTFKDGGTTTLSLRFYKGSDGKVHASGTYTMVYKDGKSDVFGVNATQTRALGGAPAAPAAPADKSKDKNPAAQNQKKPDSAKSNAGQQKKNGSQKSGAKQQKDAGKKSDYNDSARQQEAEHDDRDDLPETDAGKVAAAVGTGLGGAALGGAAGAAGAAGGAAGAAGGAAGGGAGAGGAGGFGNNFGDYNPNADYYEDRSQSGRSGRRAPGKDGDSGGDGGDSGRDYDDSGGDYDDSGRDYDDSGGDYDDSNRDYEDASEDYDDSNRDYEESGEDYEDAGEESEDYEGTAEEGDESGEDYEDAGEEGEQSGEEYEDAGEEGEESGDEYEDTGEEGDESGEGYEDAGEEGDESGEGYEDAGEESEESGDDYEDAGEEGDESGEDYEDAGEEREESGDDYGDAGEESENNRDDYEEDNRDEYEEDNRDEYEEDNRDEYEEDNRDKYEEDNRDEYEEDNRDEYEEDNRDEYEEDNRDEYEEDNRGEYEEDNRDEYEEDNRDEYEEDNRNEYDDNDDHDGSGEDHEEEREDYEDAVADDSAGDEQGDVTEAEEQPAANDMPSEEALDNMSVDDDGSICLTTPDGEKLVYTRNEDGTYNIPTQTESGLDLTELDEEGNARYVEPGQLTTKEEIQNGAQWYKEHEQEIRAERAEEDARQQAERDRLAAENAAWQAEQRAINNQLSQTSKDLAKELRQMEIDYKHEALFDKIAMKHGTVEDYVTKNKENILKAAKRDNIKEYIKGGEYEGEAAKWDDRIVTAQEVKFVADQSVNAYSTLTHNQTFANAYNAATNYAETLTDAAINNKDMGKAVLKATVDTGLDAFSNKLEDKGYHIIGNSFSEAYKKVNENIYEGRDAFEGTDEAALKGGAMGGLNKTIGKVVEKSQGTVLGKEVGNIGPDTRLDFWNKPKVGADTGGIGKTNLDADSNIRGPKADVETGGMRQTTIAERRMGEGLTKPNAPEAPSAKTNLDADSNVRGPKADAETGVPKTRPEAEPGTTKTRQDAETGTTKPRPDAEPGTTKTRPETETGTTKTRPEAEPGTTKTRQDAEPGTTKTRQDAEPGTTKPRPDAEPGTTKTRQETEPGTTKPRPDAETGTIKQRPDAETGTTKQRPDTDAGTTKTRPDAETGTTKPRQDADTGTTKPRPDADTGTTKPRQDAETGTTKTRPDAETGTTKPRQDAETGTTKQRPDAETCATKPRPDAETGTTKQRPDAETGTTKPRPDAEPGTTKQRPDAETGRSKPQTGGTEPRKTTIAERRMGKGEYKTQTSEAEAKMRINEDVQANKAMNKVRKLNEISRKMDAMEKANPKSYQNDPEYRKLAEQFDNQSRIVREDKLAIDRMNALQGETGTNLRKHYNKSDLEYEKKVLQYRNESIAEEYGLRPDQIGDMNVTSNKIEEKLAGGKSSHDTDTSPHVKVETGDANHKTVDFNQVDGDHHLARAIYKAEYGHYPRTAAEYDEALKLKQLRDFTNVSTRPSDTHESYRNPDAYVGSGKGEVNRVLEPEKYGTPEKGTGVFNEQTANHKQWAPLERHHQQYAEAQELRHRLNTDTNLSAAEKTEMGKKIADLELQSASNHYESIRTTAKEFNVIKRINDVNMKNGLKDGLSKEAKQIGEWANQVAKGKMDPGTYKDLVTKNYGSEENALKIVAKGFRDTNL